MKKIAVAIIIFALLVIACLIATTPHGLAFEYAYSKGEGYYRADNGEIYNTSTITPEGTKAKISINDNGTPWKIDDEITIIYIFD